MHHFGLVLAACACFIASCILLYEDGNHHLRVLVLAALIIGGAGPFLMQDDTMAAKVAGWMMSWAAILMSTVALVLYAVGW